MIDLWSRRGVSRLAGTAGLMLASCQLPVYAQFGGIVNGAKNIGNKASGAVSSAGNAAANAASDLKKQADDLARTSTAAVEQFRDSSTATVYKVGDSVKMPAESIGGVVSTSGSNVTRSMTKDGKEVGRVLVNNGKIAATQTVDASGKWGSLQPVSGAKWIVDSAGTITGREIVSAGAAVGEEVIRNGKLQSNKVTDTARYALNKVGDIIYQGAAGEACRAVLGGIRSHSAINLPALPAMPGLPDIPAVITQKRAELNQKLDAWSKEAGKKAATIALGEGKAAADTVAELQRAFDAVDRQKIYDIMLSDNVCSGSPAAIQQQLFALGVKPNVGAKSTALLNLFSLPVVHAATSPFFTVYKLSGDIAYYGGATAGISLITNYTDKVGLYLSIGPQAKSNIGGGGSFTLGLYPYTTDDSFEGWSWALAYGQGKKIDYTRIKTDKAGVGFELNLDLTAIPQGFGLIGQYGAGKFDKDGSFSGDWTWKLTK